MTKVTKNLKRKRISWDLSYTGLLIFLLFRIPLTNIIGNEGNGYYFVSFELFTIFYLLFGFCFHQITSELVRKNIKKYSSRSNSTLITLLIIMALIISLLGASAIIFSSKWILSLLTFELSVISIRILSIWLIISSISGVLRGYFEGCGSRIPTAFSKIIEAIVAGSSSVIFASLLYKYGFKVGNLLFNSQYQPAFGATGITCGLLCGSMFSFLFLFIIFQFFRHYQKQATGNTTSIEVTKKKIIVDILKAYFICLATYVFTYSYRVVNMYLYITTLNKHILEEKKELNIISVVGSYHGKVLVLIGIAILIILSLSGKNIPRIRKNYGKNMYEHSWKYTIDDMKQLLYISLPVSVLFLLLSNNILNLLYGKASLTETNFLKIECLNIIFIPLAIYLYRLIQKLNFNIALIVIPAISFVGQSILMYVLVNTETTRMLSIVIAEVVFWFLIFIFELLLIMKEFGKILSKQELT